MKPRLLDLFCGAGGAGYGYMLAEGQALMGIHWMRWGELVEAIPPAYTEWIGHQLLAHASSGSES